LYVSKKYFIFVKSLSEKYFSPLIQKTTVIMKDRIKQLMESQHMTQQSFAAYIDISAASLSNIFGGRTKPTLNTVEAIQKKFPTINLAWLMFGQGEMFQNEASEVAPTLIEQNGDQVDNEVSDDSGLLSSMQFDTPDTHCVQNTPKIHSHIVVKDVDKPKRRVATITVFYDDGTFDTFVPKK
jgi:transcriptional regulator with XRE-family HTH domain